MRGGWPSSERAAHRAQDMVAAGAEQGISTEVIDMVQTLIRRQIDAGHGTEAFARIKHPA